MKTAPVRILLWLAALLAAAHSLAAQDPAPALDDREFAPPKPVLAMAATDPNALIQSIVGILREENFTLTDKDWMRGYMAANKTDGPNLEDRILIYLYRDIEQPNKVVVFVDYAQYRKIFGTPGLKRVKAPDTVRLARIGSLVAKITNLGAHP